MSTQSFPVSPASVAVPVLSFLTLALDIPSLAWHIKNRNLSASLLVFWIILGNLFILINSLLWPTDDLANWWHGQIWCDIQVKLTNAGSLAILGAIGSTMRNLAIALDTDKIVVSVSPAQRRRNRIIDGLLNFGLPFYMISVHYIVQPNRYYIFAISGCAPSVDSSWPTIVLIFMWPPIVCLLDAYYAGLILVRLRKYRKNFSAILAASSSRLNKSRFIRLFVVALILICMILPVQIYVFYRNLVGPLDPYSWDTIHGPEWWDIILVPTDGAVRFDCWIQIACGFVVFFAFGFGRDAKAMYRSWCLKIGLDRICPRLHNDRLPSYSQLTRGPSFGSKARQFLAKKLSSHRSTTTFLSTNPSVITSPSTLSPSSPNKCFLNLGHVSAVSSSSNEIQDVENKTTCEPVSLSSRRGTRSWLSISTVLFSNRQSIVPVTMQEPASGVATSDWSTASNPPAKDITLPASREHRSDLRISRDGTPPEYRETAV